MWSKASPCVSSITASMRTMTGQAGIAKGPPSGQILDGTPPDLVAFQARATSAQMAKKHDQGAQRRTKEGKSQHTLNQLYSIPSALPEELVNWLGTSLALNEE